MAQYVHNMWINETTKQIPFKLLLGVVPNAHQRLTNQMMTNNQRLQTILESKRAAQEAMTKAQSLITNKRRNDYKPFQVNDQVWLEGTNLKTTHPTMKLTPRRYRPFRINNKISDVVYQLELPQQWKIHNMFHANLLTPYIETELRGRNFTNPPPDIIKGELEYEVEEVIGSR